MNKFTITGIVLGGIGGALFGNYCFENNIPYLKEKKIWYYHYNINGSIIHYY